MGAAGVARPGQPASLVALGDQGLAEAVQRLQVTGTFTPRPPTVVARCDEIAAAGYIGFKPAQLV